MFSPTDNPYQFKYLVTGITGEGIKEVYLPPVPSEDKILFKKEQKFVRPEPSAQLQEWIDECAQGLSSDPNYIHPHQGAINKWIDQEWDRCQNGIHFWNDGVITYLPPRYYKYLTIWSLYFGRPDYRETDKEVFYWIQYWEEDPNSFGGCYNTCRREGKSTKMGFWIMDRTMTNFDHFAGMQGEDNHKIQDFYQTMVMDPFYKLPYYHQPQYDTTSLQKKGIIFKEPPRRNKKKVITRKDRPVLNSRIDYRTSEENKYDQAVLHSYVGEEFGKTLSANVDTRWGFVKPCLKRGKFIRGKAFIGTTSEYMNVSNKGGQAYKKLCMESDFDVRNKIGQTKSGLYAALMPADCVLEGFFDDHGRPRRKEAMQWILDEREAVRDNPKDYATLVRKYPTNWNEVFYVSAEDCEFNIVILQDRKAELQVNPPPIRKMDLRWNNNQRFSKIDMIDNPQNGWLKMAWLPKTEQEQKWFNNVDRYTLNGKTLYRPLNNNIFASGLDPIDHGVVIESSMGLDGFVSSRRSRPVLFVKRKYDPLIDGVLTQEILEQRAREKFPYKTGRYIAMMDVRPNDPNVLFERCLMVWWLFGISGQIESSKPGVINWLNESGCSDFSWMKYVPNPELAKRTDLIQGTPASTMMTQEFTSMLATDVEYFGHTYPFIEQPEDLLQFKPLDTKKFDYAVAMGQTEIACHQRNKTPNQPIKDISTYFRSFDKYGNVINR